MDLELIRNAVLEALKESQTQISYELWYKDLEFISFDAEKCVLKTTDSKKRFLESTIHNKYLADAFISVLGYLPKLVILSDPNEVPKPINLPPIKNETELLEEKLKEEEIDISTAISEPTIITKYTFDNFVIGDSNKFAYAAAMAVATQEEDDPLSYNPLFIWGPSGVGKTHLLCSITNKLKERKPGIKILYKKGDDFTNELIDAIQKRNTADFREKYRMLDVLLIDDIHFIAGKESTQEEFFNTFTALYEKEKQIILTSDRPPKDIRLLEDRLLTRFEWGLIADIQAPNYELRTAIIRKKAAELDMELENEIVIYLAENLQNNVRQLEGAIKKISAVATLTGAKINLPFVKNTVTDFISYNLPITSKTNRIIHEIAEKYGVSEDDIKGQKRKSDINFARQVCIYLIRQVTNASYSSIGDIFSRDHSTILSSYTNIEKKCEKEKGFDKEMRDLIDKYLQA